LPNPKLAEFLSLAFAFLNQEALLCGYFGNGDCLIGGEYNASTEKRWFHFQSGILKAE